MSDAWPERADGFYDEWEAFSRSLLDALIASAPEGVDSGDRVASLLLAGGAGLGATGMLALIESNRAAIERRGEEWGIPGLATMLKGVGAALGGFGGAMITRTLTRKARPEVVESLQQRLAAVRREFEDVQRDRRDGQLNTWTHMAAVELLYAKALASL